MALVMRRASVKGLLLSSKVKVKVVVWFFARAVSVVST